MKAMSNSTNPKDLVGAKKPNLALIPAVGLLHAAMALMNGAFKYEPFNWRQEDKKVGMMTYIAAIERHAQLFKDGENVAEDTLVHHLGHIAAGAMLLLDAIESGQAVDDRPLPGKAGEVMARLEKEYKEKMLPLWESKRNAK